MWNDGRTQLILLTPRPRQLSAQARSGDASQNADLARSSSSKLVSCGSLVPWQPGDTPAAVGAANGQQGPGACALFSFDPNEEY